MDATDEGAAARLRRALDVPEASARLQAALTAGTHPQPTYIDALVARCAVEPDFFVRDMLTWALTRQERAATIERVVGELASSEPQARSQALHTLSKIGEPSTWPAITVGLLFDADDDVARAAWRTAAGLVPPAAARQLATALASQFGRGDRETRKSLSRAFVELGPAGASAIDVVATTGGGAARTHAIATARLLADPDEGFETAMWEAER